MSNPKKFLQAALSPEHAQAAIDDHLSALPDVLAQDDPYQTMDWMAEYSTITSRVSDPETVDMRFENILGALEDAGYGDRSEKSSSEKSAKDMIALTMGRIREGQVPTGYERIFADKIKSEAGVSAEGVDLG